MVASSPITVAVPDDGVVSPMSTRKSVDLPAPFGPTTAHTSPSRTDIETPARACTGLSIADFSRNFIQRPEGS